VAENRKARHNYFIEDRFEAGLALLGTEVKSLRQGQVSIAEAYAAEKGGEIFLLNATIPAYAPSRVNHDPKRPRKLLLHRSEIRKLSGKLKRGGLTLVPLRLYFNPRGVAKLELGLGRGKRKVDKREAERAKDWQREKARLLRGKR
jgi:SsrA-binding protein